MSWVVRCFCAGCQDTGRRAYLPADHVRGIESTTQTGAKRFATHKAAKSAAKGWLASFSKPVRLKPAVLPSGDKRDTNE